MEGESSRVVVYDYDGSGLVQKCVVRSKDDISLYKNTGLASVVDKTNNKRVLPVVHKSVDNVDPGWYCTVPEEKTGNSKKKITSWTEEQTA